MIQWIPRVITRVVFISMVPFLVVLLFGSYLSYRYNGILRENRELVVHTHQVIATINDLFIVIEDAETGQRGFVITGEPAYLDPYRSALQTVPRSLVALRLLVTDSPNQMDQVATLEASLEKKLDELGATIALRHLRGSTQLDR